MINRIQKKRINFSCVFYDSSTEEYTHNIGWIPFMGEKKG
jgi:hypothetical protein